MAMVNGLWNTRFFSFLSFSFYTNPPPPLISFICDAPLTITFVTQTLKFEDVTVLLYNHGKP